MLELQRAWYPSRIGTIEIAATEKGIVDISFVEEQRGDNAELPHLHLCLLQLKEYFEEGRRQFDTLPLAFIGTDFQTRVWEETMKIPFGETVTYGKLAELGGFGAATRAVGTALGRNKLAILVPCHRIIPASASGPKSGEYAWGAWRKEWLLHHERDER
ncbi:MAG: methylated-DNA--[protein]-cysteine S-methyltransferase [Candidatus Peregrinibacteria bacterium]|nr:methylated-DNA--[protein]-cysteine S-methyltransferase [Candidatus Peregrinibacteria bacterium]